MNATVLILDDDRWQRETLAAALAYEGCHAEHTGEATFAMMMLARHRFELVLIDPLSPATGGWETIKRLILLYPALRVIVLGSAAAEPLSTSITGRIDIVGKPFGFPTLLNAIQSVLPIPDKPALSLHL